MRWFRLGMEKSKAKIQSSKVKSIKSKFTLTIRSNSPFAIRHSPFAINQTAAQKASAHLHICKPAHLHICLPDSR